MGIKNNFLVFWIVFVALVFVLIILNLNINYVGIKTQNGLVKINVEVADSPLERESGLMNRKYLCSGCGMLFVFDELGEHKFWMKNTLISLDMIFVDGDKQVVFIEKDAKPCNTEICGVYPKEGIKFRYAVEVNGGFSEKNGINIGDRVLLK